MKIKVLGHVEIAANPPVKYKKDDPIIVNYGSTKEPEYYTGWVIGTKKNGLVDVEYPDGTVDSFKPTRSMVGLVGKMNPKLKQRKSEIPKSKIDNYLMVDLGEGKRTSKPNTPKAKPPVKKSGTTNPDVDYKKDDPVIVNYGSTKEPEYYTGWVVGIKKNGMIEVEYPDGTVDSFKPTRSKVGLVGKMNPNIKQRKTEIPKSKIDDYLMVDLGEGKRTSKPNTPKAKPPVKKTTLPKMKMQVNRSIRSGKKPPKGVKSPLDKKKDVYKTHTEVVKNNIFDNPYFLLEAADFPTPNNNPEGGHVVFTGSSFETKLGDITGFDNHLSAKNQKELTILEAWTLLYQGVIINKLSEPTILGRARNFLNDLKVKTRTPRANRYLFDINTDNWEAITSDRNGTTIDKINLKKVNKEQLLKVYVNLLRHWKMGGWIDFLIKNGGVSTQSSIDSVIKTFNKTAKVKISGEFPKYYIDLGKDLDKPTLNDKEIKPLYKALLKAAEDSDVKITLNPKASWSDDKVFFLDSPSDTKQGTIKNDYVEDY